MLAAAVEDRFSLVLVAEGEGAPGGLAGYAILRRAADEAELLSLAVAPEARRRGLGRRLIEDGLARVQRDGARVCYLEVRSANEPALALYGSLGFRQVGRRRRYYRDGSDALVMALRLGPPGHTGAP
jgi:ribosomal-protein-alanine N-acetyltransferase